MYDKVVAEIHPDYVIHGDNWKNGPEKAIRDNAEKLLEAYGGSIIDVPYTYNENVKRIDRRIREKLAMPEYRRKRLRQLIEICPIVKTLEVHSGLTGLIAEKTIVETDGELDQFDAMWISSLCDSTAKGKPDIELVDMTSRFRTIDDVMEVTTKPIISMAIREVLSSISSIRSELLKEWVFRLSLSRIKQVLKRIRFSERKSSRLRILSSISARK